jgi:hypothetical protein
LLHRLDRQAPPTAIATMQSDQQIKEILPEFSLVAIRRALAMYPDQARAIDFLLEHAADSLQTTDDIVHSSIAVFDQDNDDDVDVEDDDCNEYQHYTDNNNHNGDDDDDDDDDDGDGDDDDDDVPRRDRIIQVCTGRSVQSLCKHY